MAQTASAKQELLSRIESMSAAEAEDLLDYLNMLADPDELSAEEERAVHKAMAEFERGETVSGADLEREFGIELSA